MLNIASLRNLASAVTLVLIASSTILFAQAAPRQGGARAATNYNPATETTFTGTTPRRAVHETFHVPIHSERSGESSCMLFE